jgi:hypothetical protein
MNTLAALPGNACFVGPEVSLWIEWRDYSNDSINYGGEGGTIMARGHARAVLEMMKYDLGYRYGDFYCGCILLKNK